MSNVGKVYLVGAGPGDPGLLTLRGLDCLVEADLVLYDGLVNPLLLEGTFCECIRTSRVQSDGKARVPQESINAQLIEAAKAGKTVVRLKGGDPFLFGRGSEEASALAAEGIPFEVVPGVTAAIAAGEYAGIALTHRDHASAVAFVTGHENPAKGKTTVDYAVLARFPGTLVFYMGFDRLSAIADRLIAEGKAPDTPVAVVCQATLATQRTVTGILETIADDIAETDLQPPSLIIIGECVTLRERIAWHEKRPLFGKRIGITRPVTQNHKQVRRCVELGAEPVLMPTIRIEPVIEREPIQRVIESLESYDWIVFTSRNGVEFFLPYLNDYGRDARALANAKIACIGPSTASAVEFYNLIPDVVPGSYRAEELAKCLIPHVSGKRVLWCGANRGRDVLPTELTAAGADVEKLVVYQNLDVEEFSAPVLDRLRSGSLDWIGLSSPSIARRLAELIPDEARDRLGTEIKLAAISPITADASDEANLPVTVVAEAFTWDGLFDAICQYEASHEVAGG